MNKRTKCLSISPAVKRRVADRDGGMCVLCGRPGEPVCHVISRAQGGLGIEENIWTGCWDCHMAYDHGINRYAIRRSLETYLRSKYPNWDEVPLTYKKGE